MSGYNTTLDTWYQSSPWPVQKVLEWPYEQVSGWLEWVTGNPDKVAGQAPVYEGVGDQIAQLSRDAEAAADAIAVWQGIARDAFDGKVEQLTASLTNLAPAVTRTREILQAAAETSVEAANMIIDIIKSVIEFLISSLAVSAALAVFTFGASAAAWVAANLAKGAQALSQIMQGLTRVAQVLQKIAVMLEKIAQIMRKVAELLKTIREIFQLINEAKKGATLAEKALLTAASAAIKVPTGLAANPILGGAASASGMPDVSMPGGMGELWDAARSGAGAVDASNEAVEAAR